MTAGLDATVKAALSVLDGIFTLKDSKEQLWMFLSAEKMFSPYFQLALARVLLNTAAHCSS